MTGSTEKHEQKPFIHRTTCRVLYGDTDAGGVVYYGNYMRYFEMGRTEFMRDQAVSYRDIEDMGFVLPVVECHIRYKASARYDDLLIIETQLAEVSRISCRFKCRILRIDGKKETLLAKGYTINASVNREGKLTKLPVKIVQQLQKLSGN
jgi:acyl-CoA thioester hydrolase